LLLPAFEQVLSNIEDEGSYREDQDEPEREDRENLATLESPAPNC
jgi:hypothetical protein